MPNRSGLTGDGLLETFDLAGEFVAVTGPDVGLQYQIDALAISRYRIGCPPDDVEDLVPLAFKGREHRIGAIGQSGGTHDFHRSGDCVVKGVTRFAAAWQDR